MTLLTTLLLYLSPVLLNGTLLGTASLWEKLFPKSSLNRIYQVLLVLAAVGIVLNLTAGVLCWQHQHQALAVLFTLMAVLPAWFIYKLLFN